MVTWTLAYLLTGFILHFVAVEIFRSAPSRSGWKWELAAAVCWPVTVLLTIFTTKWRKR